MAEKNSIHVDHLGLQETAAETLDSLRIDHWEKRLILQALDRAGGKVVQAAKLLGIGRATLYRKLDEYGISR